MQGAPKEQLFTVMLCSCVPELIANIMHGSSQGAVSRAIVAAVRQEIINDPKLKRQHKAVMAMYRQRGAMPAQVRTTHRSMHLILADTFVREAVNCFIRRGLLGVCEKL
jgi:hypothetical protein